MLTFEQQLELKERVNEQGIPLDFTIPSPYAEIVDALLAKLERYVVLGGESNGNEPTATLTTSDAVAPTETATEPTITDGAISIGSTATTE